jgi:hypothetical protein
LHKEEKREVRKRKEIQFYKKYIWMYSMKFWPCRIWGFHSGGCEAEDACTLVSRWTHFFTLKMEAICSSERSVETQRTTRCYIPEDGTLQILISFKPTNLFWIWWMFKDMRDKIMYVYVHKALPLYLPYTLMEWS